MKEFLLIWVTMSTGGNVCVLGTDFNAYDDGRVFITLNHYNHAVFYNPAGVRTKRVKADATATTCDEVSNEQ